MGDGTSRADANDPVGRAPGVEAAGRVDELTIIRPDDWHVHLRDGAMLRTVAPWSARHFARALVMPNLVPPIRTVVEARAYRDRILAALPQGSSFEPRMTLYLTEATEPEEVQAAARADHMIAVKLYPAGATTNSQSGVRDIDKVMSVLEAMADVDLPLCVHGEVTDPDVDIFDREAVFLDKVLDPLRRRLPGLRVVLEHVTTATGVDYVSSGGPDIAGTITPHHLMINRNAIFKGGIRPHYYCLPVAKRERDRAALVAAATSGSGSFFLGTDSAPHLDDAKESACGCAGIFNAPNTLACLATVFEAAGALDRLEAFTSRDGARFYREDVNTGTIRLRRATGEARTHPASIETGEGRVRVFDPEVKLGWEVADAAAA